MLLRQFRLESKGEHQTVWLEDRLDVGNSVTLKDSDDPERWWQVTESYGIVDASDLNDSHGSRGVFGSIK